MGWGAGEELPEGMFRRTDGRREMMCSGLNLGGQFGWKEENVREVLGKIILGVEGLIKILQSEENLI